MPYGYTYTKLEKALQQADAAGDTEAARQLADAIKNKEYDEESSAVESGIQGFAQGVSFGTSDELGAALRAGTEKFIFPALYAIDQKFDPYAGNENRSMRDIYTEFQKGYPGDFGERYRRALGQQRDLIATARREDPWITGGAELLGGLTTGGTGMARSVAGKGLGAAVAKGATTGATMGAVGGYAYGEGDPIKAKLFGDDEEFRREAMEAAENVLTGAAVGGTLGGTIPAAATVGRNVARFVSRPFTKNARLNEQARRTIQESLEEDIANGHITLAQARQELADTPGMTIADLGPALRERADKLAQTPTVGARYLRDFLTERNKEQWARIHPRLSEALGRTDDNFATAKAQLINDMKSKSRELYDIAYQYPVRMTTRMREILNTPSGKSALAKGKVLRRELEKNPDALDIKGAMQSTRDLDYIIQSYDDVVSGLYKAGQGSRAKVVKELRDELREEIYSQNQYYRSARRQWSGDKSNENAMDLGLRIFNDDADIMGEVIRGMSPSERTNFKIGALRAITRKLGNKSDTSDISKGIFDSPNKREAMTIAFGGRKRFDDFMDFIEQEQKMFNTYAEAVGNSKTARRLFQDDTMGGKLAALLGYAGSLSNVTHLPPSIGAYLSRKAYETAQKNIQGNPQQMLSQGQANLLTSRNLDALMQPNTIHGLLDTGVPNIAAQGVGGLLATGYPQPGVEYGGY